MQRLTVPFVIASASILGCIPQKLPTGTTDTVPAVVRSWSSIQVSQSADDSLVLRALSTEGSLVEYFGSKDGIVPTAINRVRVLDATGEVTEITIDEFARPAELILGGVVRVRVSWDTGTVGRVTIFDNGGFELGRSTVDLPESHTSARARDNRETAMRARSDRSSPTAQTLDRVTHYEVQVTDCDGNAITDLGDRIALVFRADGHSLTRTPVWNGSRYTYDFRRPGTAGEYLEASCTDIFRSEAWSSVCDTQKVLALLCPEIVFYSPQLAVSCELLAFALGIPCFGPEPAGPTFADVFCNAVEDILSPMELLASWLSNAEVYATVSLETCGFAQTRESEHVLSNAGADVVQMSIDGCARFDRNNYDLTLTCPSGSISLLETNLPGLSESNGITVRRIVYDGTGGNHSEVEGPVPVGAGPGALDAILPLDQCDRFGVERVVTSDETAHRFGIQVIGHGMVRCNVETDALLNRTIETIRPPTADEARQLADDRATCIRGLSSRTFGIVGKHTITLMPGEALNIRAGVSVGASDGLDGGRVLLSLRPVLLGMSAGPALQLCAARPAIGVPTCSDGATSGTDITLTYDDILRNAGLIGADGWIVQPNLSLPPGFEYPRVTPDSLGLICVSLDIIVNYEGSYAIDDVGQVQSVISAEWSLEALPTP